MRNLFLSLLFLCSVLFATSGFAAYPDGPSWFNTKSSGIAYCQSWGYGGCGTNNVFVYGTDDKCGNYEGTESGGGLIRWCANQLPVPCSGGGSWNETTQVCDSAPQPDPEGVYMPEFWLYIYVVVLALMSGFIMFYPGRT